MAPGESNVDTALRVIEPEQLTPTEHLLLKEFVTEAVDPDSAARYVLQRVHNSSPRHVEEAL